MMIFAHHGQTAKMKLAAAHFVRLPRVVVHDKRNSRRIRLPIGALPLNSDREREQLNTYPRTFTYLFSNLANKEVREIRNEGQSLAHGCIAFAVESNQSSFPTISVVGSLLSCVVLSAASPLQTKVFESFDYKQTKDILSRILYQYHKTKQQNDGRNEIAGTTSR